MADSPWIKWFTSDFLTGVADLEADEIGVYTVILTLQADRGAPIDDDARWLARRCGTSTRRFNQIRERLVALGKLDARAGMLGNRRMIREISRRDGKSNQARAAALARWHSHDEPELDLPPPDADGTESAPVRAHGRTTNPPIISEKSGGKTQDKNDLISRKSGQKSQKTAVSADADASPPCAREESRDQSLESPHTPTLSPTPAQPDRLADADLQQLYEAVANASGHNPATPDKISRAYGFIERWRKDGIDFDEVVIPTIRATVASTSEPTRTLGRFDPAIRHEHARRAASPVNGRAYRPPASPVMIREGEAPIIAEIRKDLLQRLGPRAYCILVNDVRFEAVTSAGAGRKPLRIIDDRNPASRLMDGDRVSIVTAIARAHGFTDVW